ncbi:uncharacterized protein LOC134533808 isoform X2 [Bacillus rossius redtenbacheri]|uniref:uncharacterized protein LOC134533808 isoform X2 n=1 Tax=Bacillus rossius redtenbacheri TaxID=93214 RepID=UPI002FDE66D0
MAGIFEAPKWDVDASSENLNRKVFGQDSRKLSKNREKRKKKGGISQNINKVFPHSAEQFQTSYSASKNINDKVKHKTFGLVKNKPEKQTDQVIDIKQQSNKRKKKLRKKRKVGDSYVHINSENVKETSKNQLQLPKNIVQRSGKKINISASEIFPKTNSLNALKRKMCAVSAEFESDLVPAKKQMVGKSDEFDLRSKKRKNKFQKTFKRNVTATTHTNSSQKVKLGLSQKDLKGIVNKAFSANSSMHGDSVNCNDQVSKKKKHKRDSRKQKDLKGIVNEGFSANLSVHADSVNYNDHVSKKKKCKRDSWNQKDSKGIVNEAFSVESSLQEDSFDPNHDVPSEIKAKKYPQKKNSIGIVNEAFSAESSFQSDNTFQYSLQMPKQEKGKKYQQKQNSGGIVNEAFSANSSIRDDSFDGRVPKKKKPTRNLEEQKNSKGIANDVFSAESSLQDDTTSRTHQILEQSKAKRDLQIEKSKGKTNEEFREHQLSQEESKPVNCIVDNPKSKKRLRVASLRERMMAKLKASRFRYLNEQIYTSESTEIHKYFANDKNAFKAYHEAFQNQVTQWPLNPLDRIINALKKNDCRLGLWRCAPSPLSLECGALLRRCGSV